MRVSTRCRTIDELIAAFATLVDEESLVVLTDAQRAIGSRQPFVVELADGTFVMRGEAEVVESTPPPRGRLRLKFLALDAGGREVHQQMLARKKGTTVSGQRSPTMPLVRIPERGEPAPAPPAPPSPSVPSAPLVPSQPPKVAAPAPFARPVPAPPTKPRVVPAVPPVPSVPSRATVHGMAPLTAKLPAPAIPSVPKPGAVPGVPVEPLVPKIDPGTGLPSFADNDEMNDEMVDDRTAVDTSVPALVGPPIVPVPAETPAVETPHAPAPPPASSIEAAVRAAAKPRPGTAPVEGERTPGSPYILPANPFGDVAPESLEAFVECMVYEETGQFSFGEGGLVNELVRPNEDLLDDPAVDPPTTPAFPMYTAVPAVVAPSAPPPAATPPSINAEFQPPPAAQGFQQLPPAVFQPPPALAFQAPPAPSFQTPSIAPQTHAVMPMAAAADAQFPPYESPQSGAIDLLAVPANRPPWKWIGLGLAGAVAIVVIALLVSRGGGADAKASAGTGKGTVASHQIAADASTKAMPVVGIDAGAQPTTPDAGTATPTTAAPDAGSAVSPIPADECHLKLTVEPEGAHIKLSGAKIGDAPIDAAIPCAPAVLTIVRSHHETVTKRIKPEPGEPVVLDVKMIRPDVKLSISSTPPGALITIDGRSLGKAPTSTTVKGYISVKIEASLKGYSSWSKRIKVEKSDKKVSIPLKKQRR